MVDTSTEAVTKLLDGVTPGPWRIKDCESAGYRCANYHQEIWNEDTDILVTTEVTRAHNDGGAKNMRFIRAARDLVPALLAERDALKSEVEQLKAQPVTVHDAAKVPEIAALIEAVSALGAMPEGYCFCSENRVGDESKQHEPECRDLRAAIKSFGW